MAAPDRIIATILGCGSSGGVPRIGNDWGVCDPDEPRNRRRRCALLIEGWRDGIDEPTRVLIDTGVDLFALMDLAEDVIVPLMDQQVRVDRESLTLGYAGLYSTFLLPARKAARQFGVSTRDILVELGRMKVVGGQEDMIEDTALTLARRAAERGRTEAAR